MRVHTVVVGSVLGMIASSALAWTVGAGGIPPSAKAAESTDVSIKTWTGSTETAVTAPRVAKTQFEVGGPLLMSGRVGNAVVAAQREDETFVFVNLSAATERFGQAAIPANVTIVLDRSGSMKGSRMNTALTAARAMVTRLRDTDTVSVVTYAQNAEMVVVPTTLNPSSRAAVLRALSTITARGNTCISCGLEQALAMAPRRDGAVHRIVLLSDGKANRGGRTLAEFSGIAQQARRSQTAVTSIGVGVDYDERLLASLSRGTNGAHHFVERLSQLAPIFEQELQTLALSVAASATVEVQLAPGVELLEVVDRASSRDGQRLIVPFGSFSAGEDKTLLMRVRLPPREHGVQTVGDIALRYTDASTGRRERADATLEVGVGDTKSELVPTVVARIAQSETVRDIGTINALIDAGRDDAASIAITRSRKRIRKRRDESVARGLKPTSAAADSFAFQDAALGKAGLNVEEARQARVQGKQNAPTTRKAASKRNAALASPFN